jgi:hypothetical protein
MQEPELDGVHLIPLGEVLVERPNH